VARRILLIIGGGIAAYKSLDLIRRLKERGHGVRVVLTRAAQEFVTPLAAGALSNDRVFTDLFDLDDEREIGHIRLSREADLLVVAPATADLLAKMATGQAGDLATAVLLATDKPVLVAPAMNPRMWDHKATQRNVRQLVADGIHFVGPNAGEMAERGEAGVGRMAEAIEIADAVDRLLAEPLLNRKPGPLSGRHVLVTSGPTHEPIDPVRYIANRSSGKQGHAIAAAAVALGARVTLVSGPVSLAQPADVATIPVETADQMLAAVQAALPADIVICAAAVADWRVASAAGQKLKKGKGKTPPPLALAENPDILKTVAALGPRRPALVIGFAAETEDVVAHAQKKRQDKGADWIVANDVSPATGTFGGDRNAVHLISATATESWPAQSKDEVARQLVARAAQFLADHRADE
jgi:phosphopantothenoylcysteine decarboxylase/phosphopantothenate--cysteine ligase